MGRPSLFFAALFAFDRPAALIGLFFPVREFDKVFCFARGSNVVFAAARGVAFWFVGHLVFLNGFSGLSQHLNAHSSELLESQAADSQTLQLLQK